MKFIFTLLLLLSSLICFCQDTTTVEQYCKVIVWEATLTSKVTIDVEYGEERKLWKNYTLRDTNGKKQKFNSEIDALNYLGKMGWKLVNAFPVKEHAYWYLFKKEINKNDLEKESLEELMNLRN